MSVSYCKLCMSKLLFMKKAHLSCKLDVIWTDGLLEEQRLCESWNCYEGNKNSW